MIFGKNRVEEDLEKIRRTNLPYKYTEHESIANDSELKLENGDVLAMILAIMSLILPYIAAFIGIMAVIVFLLGFLY
ncbi:MAG: hypothetical protein K0R07_917 [Sedimentibacter sp.]|nr:hypothetical protein [Sedimentibacter sp.]